MIRTTKRSCAWIQVRGNFFLRKHERSVSPSLGAVHPAVDGVAPVRPPAADVRIAAASAAAAHPVAAQVAARPPRAPPAVPAAPLPGAPPWNGNRSRISRCCLPRLVAIAHRLPIWMPQVILRFPRGYLCQFRLKLAPPIAMIPRHFTNHHCTGDAGCLPHTMSKA